MADVVERLADALLFEGYALYPYRASSLKNQHRFCFGVLHPPAWSARSPADATRLRVECLIEGDDATTVAATLRFLRLAERADGWAEAAVEAVALPPVTLGERRDRREPVAVGERLLDGDPDRRLRPLAGAATFAVAPVEAGLFRLRLEVANETSSPASSRDAALLDAFVAAHLVLRVESGAFVSLADPPPRWSAAARASTQEGVWPVPVGDPERRDSLLVSPILLEDFPRLAPESPGDLFDATEIDEMLSLRILTLSNEEKLEAAALDPRVGRLLERTAALGPEALARLHGALREGGR